MKTILNRATHTHTKPGSKMFYREIYLFVLA